MSAPGDHGRTDERAAGAAGAGAGPVGAENATGTTGADVVRRAFEALARGDVVAMLADVDPGVEWTYLDPSEPDPQPSTCRGRRQLERLAGNAWQGMTLEEVVPHGDRVLVVTRTPGAGRRRTWATGDVSFHVVTLDGGRVVALHACRSRREAEELASKSTAAP